MSKNPTDVIREQQKPIEQLDKEHETDDFALGGIPVTWKDPTTGRQLKGRPLISPTTGDVEVFGRGVVNVCGQCKFYDLENGRREIIKQRFAERLVYEEQWQLHHLGDVDSLGICKQNPSMAVTYISRACDLFQIRSGKRR